MRRGAELRSFDTHNMGLQLLKLKEGTSDRLLGLATEVGMDYIRTSSDATGLHHWFKRPKQNREYAITLQSSTEHGEILRMGVSALCFALAERLAAEELLIPC
ncbi:MAG: hypothetical protein RL088_1491 [Verrucomicrobiota bacterium]